MTPSLAGVTFSPGCGNTFFFSLRLQLSLSRKCCKLISNFLLPPDIAMDWSDHAMWWPEKNVWLDKTRWTLDQYNITADAVIHFTPMHKTLRIQLPDLRYIDCNVDFSIQTFSAVINLCSELGETFRRGEGARRACAE